jgi:hypothetical protein
MISRPGSKADEAGRAPDRSSGALASDKRPEAPLRVDIGEEPRQPSDETGSVVLDD